MSTIYLVCGEIIQINNMKTSIKIGTRGSKLALVQAEMVKTCLEKIPDITADLIIIKTKGDRILNSPLSSIGDKGLFITELEQALISKEIDIAVHSLKDMPTDMPDSLTIGGVLKRNDVRDVLVSRDGGKLKNLGFGKTIATSSLRRRAQLLKFNPEFSIIDIRGNIDTRIKKMKNGYCDALVQAGAGIKRVGLEKEITEYLEPEIMLPAVCQGIIGMEIRKDDKYIKQITEQMSHPESYLMALAERAFLKEMQGGCQVPIGCITSLSGNLFQITGAVLDLNGTVIIKEKSSCSLDSILDIETAIDTSVHLAELILQHGGEKILRSIRDMQNKKETKVYLVGAGPGDEDLITLKAVNTLKKADVLIYDNLVNEKHLNYCPENCEKIYAGKMAAQHTLTQEKINSLIVKKAQEGKIVVRLKGGDPFIFGRGGEEALVLSEKGIEFEIIPGITAGLAASAYAGIPLTNRGMASTVTLITGHEMEGKNKSDINWENISKDLGTLVFYMGVKNLPIITSKLMQYGKPDNTPTALIQWGTLEFQKTLTGTLKDINKKAREANFKPPAIIVVGEVVSLREKLKWFERKPLFGKKIIITRSRSQASVLAEKLKELGADVKCFPTISIEPVRDFTLLDQAIININSFTWIIFTSQNSVKIFFQRLNFLKYDTRCLNNVKIGAIGKETGVCLNEYGIIPDLIPKTFTSEGMIIGLKALKKDFSDERVLIPGSKIARDYVPAELEKMGAEIQKIPIYDTVETEYSKADIEDIFKNEPVLFTFTSSSTVKNLVSILKKNKIEDYLLKIQGASIGPVTTKTAEDSGIQIKTEANPHTITGLVDSICRIFGNRKGAQ